MKQRKKQTLSEIVSDRIKTYISEQQCQPGDRLPSEKAIIDMLGVSRTAVREALKSLQSQGIIEIKQGLGIFVKEVKIEGYFKNISPFLKFDEAKFKELIDTRMILEIGAIELAIKHYQIDKLKEMEKWNEQFYEMASQGKKPKNEDLLFHKALFQATGNDTFIQLSYIINEYFQANQLEDVIDVESYKTSYQEHKLVIDSMLNKDMHTAKEAMRKHMSHLYKLIDN